MNILITGVTGLLGRTIVFENKNYNFNIIGGFYPNKKFETLKQLNKKYLLDIRDKQKIENIIKTEKIEKIINCASIANVDYVEKNKEECLDINFGGLKNIVDLCKQYNIELIHISSNAVYDGEKPLYKEDSKRNPLNYYGKIKVMEEDYIVAHLHNYAIVRPILMYGWNDSLERENPWTWQLRMQKENKELKIVDDIYCNPLLVNDCAKIILKIIDKNINGIFNVAGSEILSRYDFAVKIAELTKYDTNKIIPVKNSYFESISPRPKNSSFDIQKIKQILDYIPLNINDGLKKLIL